MSVSTTHAVVPFSGSPGSLALPAIGNLEAYISAVHNLPMLSAERESELSRVFRETGDLAAARELVMSHLRLVVSISRQYLGYGLPHGDLIQEGSIGLMKAVKRFDPERGVRLVSFAMHWIKAEIHEYILKNWRLVKIATTKAQRKLFFNLRSLKTSASALSPSEVQTIAKDLNVRESDVLEMETRISGQEMALDGQFDDGEESYAPIAYLASPDTEPDQQLEAQELDHLKSEGIEQALASLDDRSRRIIETRWLRDADDGGTLTLQDLASQYGVSAERIRQIEGKALQKMREALSEYA